jgi:hypothetical protein
MENPYTSAAAVDNYAAKSTYTRLALAALSFLVAFAMIFLAFLFSFFAYKVLLRVPPGPDRFEMIVGASAMFGLLCTGFIFLGLGALKKERRLYLRAAASIGLAIAVYLCMGIM